MSGDKTFLEEKLAFFRTFDATRGIDAIASNYFIHPVLDKSVIEY
jgi:hypothetical protein